MTTLSDACPLAKQRVSWLRRYWRRFLMALGFGLLVAVPAFYYENFVRLIPLRIAPETTYFTEPLNEHGELDFAAAMNKRFGKAVPPHENVIPLLWEIAGVDPAELKQAQPLLAAVAHLMDLSKVPPRRWKSLHQAIDEELGRRGLSMATDPAAYVRETAILQNQLQAARSRPFTREEFPWIAEHLESSTVFWQEMTALLKRSAAEVPQVDNASYHLLNTVFTVILPTGRKGELLTELTTYGLLQWGNGQYRAGFSAIYTALHLSKTLLQLPDRKVLGVITRVCISDIFPAVSFLLCSSELTATEREQLHKSLTDFPLPPFTEYVNFTRVENLIYSVQTIAAWNQYRHEESLPFWLNQYRRNHIDPNSMLITINRYFDEIETVFQSSTYQSRSLALDQTYLKYKYPYPLATEPDPLHFLQLQFAGQGGRGHLSALDVLLHCQPKTFLTSENHLLSLEASRRMLLILLAAGQFRAEQGIYPPSLAALVPDYLPELLIDPFTQQPFHYQAQKDRLSLISPGPDWKLGTAGAEYEKDDLNYGNW